MKVGSYIRTPEIRKKNSLSKIGVPSKLKGIPNPGATGRPRRIKRIKNICPICNKEFEKLETQPKIYCSCKCFAQIRKGKPWYFGPYNKDYMQTEEYRATKRNPDTSEYKKYRNRVQVLTKHTYNKFKNEINPNNLPITRAGIDGGYQVDHIYSVRVGFDNHVSEEFLAKKENLRVITWQKNLERNRKWQ
jgi:hypothetical protein